MSEPPLGRLDTESVTLDAFVEQVGEVLGRAHSLFGEPATSGRSLAQASGSELTTAGNLVRGGISQVLDLEGEFADDYAAFADQAASDLDGLAGSRGWGDVGVW